LTTPVIAPASTSNSSRNVNGHRRSHSDSNTSTLFGLPIPAGPTTDTQTSLENVSARKILEGLASVGAGGGWSDVKEFTLEFADTGEDERFEGSRKRGVSEVSLCFSSSNILSNLSVRIFPQPFKKCCRPCPPCAF
jgi:hypothetical protein